MKKFRILSALLVLVTAIGFTSCDSESPTLGNNTGPGADPNAPSLVVATGLGNFEAEDITAVISNGAIVVTGSQTPGNGGNAITMTLNKTRLRLNREYNNVALSYVTPTKEYTSVNNSTGEVSGTIIITSLDVASKKMSGNFSFRGWDTDNLQGDPVVFYNGKFTNVPYTGTDTPEILPAVADADEFIKAKAGTAALTTFTNFNTDITSSQTLVLNGATDATQPVSIMLEFPLNVSQGEYPISQSSMVKATYTNDAGVVFTATEGTLIVESNDEGLMKATFNFIGENTEAGATIQITEGDINIEY